MGLEEIIAFIEEIIEDRTVPRNIREVLKSVKECIESEDEKEVKKDRAIQLLDDISNDPNMPVYTRTQIWNIISMIEEA